MENLKNKQLPFAATVEGQSLNMYDWKNGDRLVVLALVEDLDSENNEYLWKVKNLDKADETNYVATSQMVI